MKNFNTIILSILAIGVSVLAFTSIYSLLTATPQGTNVTTNYEEIVVILLTTVTVIFTISALIIGILAFIGPMTIKREAQRYAESAVLQSIAESLEKDGAAIKVLETKFPPNEGHMKDFLENLVEKNVIKFLPLILARVEIGSNIGAVDPNANDDEGEVD